MIFYEEQQTDTEITFLLPREDDRTINNIARAVKNHNEIKADQLHQVINWIENEDHCKTRLLLHYFGEKTGEDCGNCSYCVKKLRSAQKKTTGISNVILSALENTPRSSRELAALIQVEESILLEQLSLLLAEEKIDIKEGNKYYRTK
nr:RecQ family zinc-binding domain-containing protein [Robertkochia sp. 3YJGBD-33]